MTALVLAAAASLAAAVTTTTTTTTTTAAPPPSIEGGAPVAPAAAGGSVAPGAAVVPSVPASDGASPALGLDRVLPAPPPPAPPRPRFDLTIGMGIAFDSSGLVDGRTVAVPAFQLAGGIGGGLVGLDVRLGATQASGRYRHKATPGTTTDAPVDRLSVDLGVAVRPLALKKDAGAMSQMSWTGAMLRTFAITAAAAAENSSTGQQSALRLGLALGARVDIPIFVSLERDDGYIGVRIGVRRMLAGKKEAGPVEVASTRAEVMAGLVSAF